MELNRKAFEQLTPLITFDFNSSGTTIDEQYKDAAVNTSVILQVDDIIFTFLLTASYVSNRLYFRILNSEGTYEVEFTPLAEYPINLIANIPAFYGYFLYFYNNSLYFGNFNEAKETK